MPSVLPAIDIQRFRNIGTNVALLHELWGRPSILYHHCTKAIRAGHDQFILMCLKEKSGTFAFDITSRDPESHLNAREIRSWYYTRRGYWQRLLPKKLKVWPVNVRYQSVIKIVWY